MEARNVIEMKMAQEKIDGFFLFDIPVELMYAVAGVEDDIFTVRFDQDRKSITSGRVIPPVRPEKNYAHRILRFFTPS
jgi:hypothetical protein